MSDILTTRSLGDATILRSQTGGGATPTAAVLVADAALKLPNQTVGTLINGIVLEKAARGVYVIQTDKGSLTIQASLPLQAGSALVLQLQSVGAQSRVVILSINGHPIAASDGQTPVPPTNAGPSHATTETLPRNLAHQTAGAPVSGGHTAPHPGPPATSATRAALAGSSALPGLVGGERIPGESARPPLTNGLVLPAQVLGTASENPGGPPGTALRTGETLTVRVLAVSSEAPATMRPQVPAQNSEQNWLRGTLFQAGGTQLAGAVTSSVSSGSGVLLSTPQGTLSLPALPGSQNGNNVLLEIIGRPSQSEFAPRDAISQSQQSFHRLAQEWATLKDAAAALVPAGNEAVATSGPLPLPTPGPALASTILFFLAAMKAGDLRSWLGQAAAEHLDGIQGGRVIARLADDFSQLARLSSDPQPSGWQVMLVPFARGDTIEQIRMYYRHHRGGEGGHEEGAGRFVVEAEFKRFGAVQLDGLVKPRQFDLVLRSEIQFSPEMRDRIRGIFESSLEIGGLHGAVKFESPTRNSIDPFRDESRIPRHESDVVV